MRARARRTVGTRRRQLIGIASPPRGPRQASMAQGLHFSGGGQTSKTCFGRRLRIPSQDERSRYMNARKTLITVAIAALIPLGATALAGDNGYGSKDKSG